MKDTCQKSKFPKLSMKPCVFFLNHFLLTVLLSHVNMFKWLKASKSNRKSNLYIWLLTKGRSQQTFLKLCSAEQKPNFLSAKSHWKRKWHKQMCVYFKLIFAVCFCFFHVLVFHARVSRACYARSSFCQHNTIHISVCGRIEAAAFLF